MRFNRSCRECGEPFVATVTPKGYPNQGTLCSWKCRQAVMQRAKIARINATIGQRFWARVDRSAGPDACWPWTARTNKFGYGMVKMRGKYLPASRAALILSRGSIPDDMFACHHCDNPICCNPRHIYAGTPKQNTQDIRRRGLSVSERRKLLAA